MLLKPLVFEIFKVVALASLDRPSNLQHPQRAVDWIADAHVVLPCKNYAPLGQETCAEHPNEPTCRHPDDVAPCAGVKDLA